MARAIGSIKATAAVLDIHIDKKAPVPIKAAKSRTGPPLAADTSHTADHRSSPTRLIPTPRRKPAKKRTMVSPGG
jgi:hypothetical protein